MNLTRLTKLILSLIVILSNISCDQITKDMAREHIEEREIIQVVDDHIVLTKVENAGAALSLGENLSPNLKIILLQLLPILVLTLMFVYIIRTQKIARSNIIAFSFIIGGGIGNIYDRILYGSVTDFMFLEWGSLHTGIFNMADVSVVVGTLLLFVHLVQSEITNSRFKVSW